MCSPTLSKGGEKPLNGLSLEGGLRKYRDGMMMLWLRLNVFRGLLVPPQMFLMTILPYGLLKKTIQKTGMFRFDTLYWEKPRGKYKLILIVYLRCQVFRSIDSGSLKGFPKNVHTAKKQVCLKLPYSLLFQEFYLVTFLLLRIICSWELHSCRT